MDKSKKVTDLLQYLHGPLKSHEPPVEDRYHRGSRHLFITSSAALKLKDDTIMVS